MPRECSSKEAVWRRMRVVSYREGQGMSLPVFKESVGDVDGETLNVDSECQFFCVWLKSAVEDYDF